MPDKNLTNLLNILEIKTDVPGLILWRYLINKGNFCFYSHKCSHVYNGIIDFYLTKHLTK
jgi:hypothetical protein